MPIDRSPGHSDTATPLIVYVTWHVLSVNHVAVLPALAAGHETRVHLGVDVELADVAMIREVAAERGLLQCLYCPQMTTCLTYPVVHVLDLD